MMRAVSSSSPIAPAPEQARPAGLLSPSLALVLALIVLALGLTAILWTLSRNAGSSLEIRKPKDTAAPLADASAGPSQGILTSAPGNDPLPVPPSLAIDPASDWPSFRGPDRTGHRPSSAGLARFFPPAGPPVLWSTTVGEGYAGPVAWAGRVYLMDYDRDQQADALRCLRLSDGAELWRFAYPLPLKRNHGLSRTIPAVGSGVVVAMGPKCHVTALDAITGQRLWFVDLVKDFGTQVPDWYAGQCPLIDGERVIIAPAGPDVLMFAAEIRTGRVIWRTPNDRRWTMTHASITPVDFAGRRMLVYAGSGGVVGVDAADGAILWQTTEWKIPIATVPSPVDLGSGRVLLTGGYNAGAMILAISEAAGSGKFEVKIEKVLRTRDFAATQQTPIVRGSQVYAITAGRGSLTCVDGSGQTIWTSGRDETFGLGPLLMAGDLIYALSEEGRLVLAEAGGGEFKKLAAAKVLEGHEAWGPMALAGARLLVRDFTTLRCLDVGATQP